MRFTSFLENINTPFALRSEMHILRKFWHVGTGITGLVVYHAARVDQMHMGKFLLLLSLCTFLIDTLRLRSALIKRIMIPIMSPFMRDCERESYSGLPFYALGVGLSLLIYEEKIAVLSIMFLVFSDPISSYFGIKFGKDKLVGNKSLQGTMAGFVTCYFLALFYSLSSAGGVADSFNILAFSLIGALIGAAAELFSTRVDDNLTIPLFSGLGLTLINLFFKVF